MLVVEYPLTVRLMRTTKHFQAIIKYSNIYMFVISNFKKKAYLTALLTSVRTVRVGFLVTTFSITVHSSCKL